MRESLRQDLIDTWEDFKVTSAHVTQDEADTWLAKLEDGEDVDAPVCHGERQS
jgi:hypothetical protein